MSTPESPAPQSQFEILAAEIDQHLHRSDPHHYEMEAFFQVIRMGEVVLPDLFASDINRLWKMHAVMDIAKAIGKPIAEPAPGTSVTTQEWRETLLAWGEQNGYIAAGPAAE